MQYMHFMIVRRSSVHCPWISIVTRQLLCKNLNGYLYGYLLQNLFFKYSIMNVIIKFQLYISNLIDTSMLIYA